MVNIPFLVITFLITGLLLWLAKNNKSDAAIGFVVVLFGWWCFVFILPNLPFFVSPSTPPVSGKVIDKETGKPLPNVFIKAAWSIAQANPGGGHSYVYKLHTTKTDKNGEFKVPRGFKAVSFWGAFPLFVSYFGGVNIHAFSYDHKPIKIAMERGMLIAMKPYSSDNEYLETIDNYPLDFHWLQPKSRWLGGNERKVSSDDRDFIVRSFRLFEKKYPLSTLGEDSLFKLAGALSFIDGEKEHVTMLQEVIEKYPYGSHSEFIIAELRRNTTLFPIGRQLPSVKKSTHETQIERSADVKTLNESAKRELSQMKGTLENYFQQDKKAEQHERDGIREISSGPLTEAELAWFKVIGGNLKNSYVLRTREGAQKYLKILLKGNHRTNQWYADLLSGGVVAEPNLKAMYGSDMAIAVEKLLWFNDIEKLEELEQLLVQVLEVSWDYPDAVAKAARHLRKTQQDKVANILKMITAHPDKAARREAAASLLIIGNSDTALAVLDELVEKQIDVQAFEYLFTWNAGKKTLVEEKGLPVVFKALTNNNLAIRALAVDFLWEFGKITREDAEKISFNTLNLLKDVTALNYKIDGSLVGQGNYLTGQNICRKTMYFLKSLNSQISRPALEEISRENTGEDFVCQGYTALSLLGFPHSGTTYVDSGSSMDEISIVKTYGKTEYKKMTAAELHSIGIKLFYDKKYSEAVAVWLLEAEKDPNNANTVNNIAVAFNYLQDYGRALKHEERALNLDPKFGHAYMTRGRTYLCIGKYEAARQELLKAINNNWRDADTYFNLGLAYTYLNMEKEAQEAFKTVKSMNPGYPAINNYIRR